MNKYRKKTIVLLSILGILSSAILVINWYITNRLESRIAAILVRNIEEATGGLYTLTYDQLSIGLYDGELSISNLHFFPDSTVYEKWKNNDSLPKEIIDLKFKNIHFKGVNLKLIRENRDLRFTLFDIDESKIKITVPLASDKTKDSEPTHIDDPYLLIKNHLKTLNVRELNLKNAQVEYIVEDSIEPSRYAITNTDFSIYNFHLDKNSYKNGKLLFSDNIFFKIKKPQILLSNSEFNLSIKELNLSTKDSVIIINGVKLKSLVNSKNKQSRELNAELDEISFHGIALSRINEDRILSAKRFDINAPEIKMSYHMSESTNSSDDHNDTPNDAVIQSASLYEIIAPILAKIQIDTISISKANFNYTVYNQNAVSNYSFSSLNFTAENFLVDSAHISKYDFIHCKEFSLEAKQLEASIAELNYKMNVEAFLFDTKKSLLSVDDIKLTPLHDQKNSVSGKIKKIVSNNISLRDNLIKSENLLIYQPDVYIKSKKQNTRTAKPATKQPKLGVSLFLDFIMFNNGTFKLEQDSDFYFANGVDMSIYDFRFDDNYNIKNLTTKISHLGGKLNTSSASFEASNINYNSINKSFEAHNLNYISSSISLLADKFSVNNLSFNGLKKDSINAHSIELVASMLKNEDLNFSSPNIKLSDFSWASGKANISSLVTSHPQFSYLSKELEIKTELDELAIEGVLYANNKLTINKNTFKKPNIYLSFSQGEKKERKPSKVSLEKINFGEISIDKGKLQIENIRSYIDHFSNLDISAKDISFSPNSQALNYDLVTATIPNISVPLDNGFYSLNSENIFTRISKSTIDLKISGINLKSKYPKFEFAHHHPQNKDWFGLNVGSINLEGIDIEKLKQNEEIHAKSLFITDTYLDNLKNQNIEIQHNIMPMIYEVVQNFPKKFKITNTDIKNFNVTYEEMAKGKDNPGKIFFTNMNGKVSNFTNIADSKDQYLDVYANGFLMGTGYFDALWQIPVSAKNDNFKLKAKLVDFDLKELNHLISPMAPVAINSGYASSVDFDISASSIDAHINMSFIYNDLNVSLWSQKNGRKRNEWLFSKATNLLIKKDNLYINKNKPRLANLYVKRDPYHSTFNYFWQILQPAVAESVGVTEKRQNRLKNAGKVFNNVKNFFKPKKKEESTIED